MNTISLIMPAAVVVSVGLIVMPFRQTVHAQTFEYDGSGRIIQATYPSGANVKYKYDAAGNLKKAKVSPAVTVSISSGDSNRNTIRFAVYREGDLSKAVTVGLTTEGDAENGQDYSGLPWSITFPAQESAVSFSITVPNNRPKSKRLVVKLVDNVEYELGQHSSAVVMLPGKE